MGKGGWGEWVRGDKGRNRGEGDEWSSQIELIAGDIKG